jgi:hypothetical protein
MSVVVSLKIVVVLRYRSHRSLVVSLKIVVLSYMSHRFVVFSLKIVVLRYRSHRWVCCCFSEDCCCIKL